MTSDTKTVAEYLKGLPDDRREMLTRILAVIRKHLPEGFAETMQYGMISWVVPHSIYPAGYHTDPKQALPFASLASQKNHMALYLLSVYQDPALEAWFREQYATRGLKLDMGKSCVRFKKLEQLPLDVIGELIAKVPVAEYIARYEAGIRKK